MPCTSFNNLTKSLSFNIYDICYANSADHRREYRKYIDELYNAQRLTEILTTVTSIIGANVVAGAEVLLEFVPCIVVRGLSAGAK